MWQIQPGNIQNTSCLGSSFRHLAAAGENDSLLRTGLHQDPRPQAASPAWRYPSAQKAGDDGAGARESMCEELLQQALCKSELGDVRFHVDGEWVASGHRIVLSARSGVLARMFANETEEEEWDHQDGRRDSGGAGCISGVCLPRYRCSLSVDCWRPRYACCCGAGNYVH
jgi:hypothetical protein